MSYEDLRIYKLSLEGVKYVFKITKSASLKSNFSLNDQILRASTSISANIAEGYGRGSKKEFKYFLTISIGSVNEVKAFLDIISTLYSDIKTEEIKNFYERLGKQIWTFRKTIK
ncbi:MAG: S23 ribosomal protein [Candidatus Woesebacteria bacterium GW2011_GWB1_38_8b]|uniref:S23 ribosomal protein n=1 Tax=Candidatus Woesebacteria bacterium GW2011_GWB1_38_8b TaxID=1618571 RepID=A0A0G0L8X7_9BACT|nr:MAG: S23 ribosomal protein [Candidatus Woesebacteria bacterium GW2011_GWB1_38_8b]